MAQTEHSTIPKLDLEEFQFSPPGSMGWSYAEYEKIVDSDDQVLTVNTTSNLSSPPVPNQPLRELPQGSTVYPVHFEPLEEKETPVVPSTEATDVESSEQPEGVENNLCVEAEEPEELEETEGSKNVGDYALAVRRITTPQKLSDKKSKPYVHITRFDVRKEKVEDEQSDPMEEVTEEFILETEFELSEIDVDDLDDVEEEVEVEKEEIINEKEETESEEVKDEEDSLIEESEVDTKATGVFFVKTTGSRTQPWLSF